MAGFAAWDALRAIRRAAVCGLLVFATAASAFAAPSPTAGLQPVPPPRAHVVEETGTLDPSQLQALESRLAAFEKAKGSQLAVLIVATTQPEDIAAYANRVGNAWKIGRKGVGDGLVVVVAKNDRKIRIEVAKTLEGAVPDLAAKQVIDDAITPAFRRGDYAGGLQAGVEQLIARINGEALPAPEAPAEPESGGAAHGSAGDGFQWTDLAIFLFFAVPVAASVLRRLLGRKLGALLTGAGVGTLALLATASWWLAAVAGVVALFFALIVGAFPTPSFGGGSRRGGGWSSGSGGGGGWSSGSDSGGFSSGGGGDFGGGGASGDW